MKAVKMCSTFPIFDPVVVKSHSLSTNVHIQIHQSDSYLMWFRCEVQTLSNGLLWTGLPTEICCSNKKKTRD